MVMLFYNKSSYVKWSLFLFSICLSLYLNGQRFQLTFRGEKLNFIDTNGLKQGKWIEFKKNDTTSLNFKTGFYKNNKMIGRWEVQSWYIDYNVKMVINFNDDGWFNIENTQYAGLTCNEDSSILYIARIISDTQAKKTKMIAFKDGKGHYEIIIYNKMGQVSERKQVITFDDLLAIVQGL